VKVLIGELSLAQEKAAAAAASSSSSSHCKCHVVDDHGVKSTKCEKDGKEVPTCGVEGWDPTGDLDLKDHTGKTVIAGGDDTLSSSSSSVCQCSTQFENGEFTQKCTKDGKEVPRTACASVQGMEKADLEDMLEKMKGSGGSAGSLPTTTHMWVDDTHMKRPRPTATIPTTIHITRPPTVAIQPTFKPPEPQTAEVKPRPPTIDIQPESSEAIRPVFGPGGEKPTSKPTLPVGGARDTLPKPGPPTIDIQPESNEAIRPVFGPGGEKPTSEPIDSLEITETVGPCKCVTQHVTEGIVRKVCKDASGEEMPEGLCRHMAEEGEKMPEGHHGPPPGEHHHGPPPPGHHGPPPGGEHHGPPPPGHHGPPPGHHGGHGGPPPPNR